MDPTDAEFTFGTIPGSSPIGTGSIVASHVTLPSSRPQAALHSRAASRPRGLWQSCDAGHQTLRPGALFHGYYNYGNSTSASGVLTISSILQEQIAMYVSMGGLNGGGGSMFPTYYGYTGSPFSGNPYYPTNGIPTIRRTASSA